MLRVPLVLSQRLAWGQVSTGSELQRSSMPLLRRASHWMVQRETAGAGLSGASSSCRAANGGNPPGEEPPPLHPLWLEVAPPAGHPGRRGFYLNPYSGALSRQRYEAPPPVRRVLSGGRTPPRPHVALRRTSGLWHRSTLALC